MGVDASFPEYVVARWSRLYRLAALLVGADEAEAVTRAALVKACLSWPDVRRAASPDVRVICLLAGVAARTSPVPTAAAPTTGVPAARPEQDRLWQEIAALPPRQRAVLVLRHHAGLVDTEVGNALGVRADVVAAEARALETGIDPAVLRSVLLARSDGIGVPPPPDDLPEQARAERSRRRRRSWRRAAGAAAVLVTALTVATRMQATSDGPPKQHPATQPARFLSQLPRGLPPRIAWTEGRWLHLGSGQQVGLDDVAAGIVQTQKWLYVAYPSGRIVRVDAVKATVLPVVRSSRGELATDPSGEHVAWIAGGTGPAVVVLRTVADWSVLLSDRQRFPADPRCCDDPFVLNGITGDGQVIGSLPVADRAWTWTTPDAGASELREITGLGGGAITQVVPDGLVVRRPSGSYAVGGLVAGIFRPTTVLSVKQADFADPYSRRVVYADDDGQIRVRDRAVRGRSRRPGQDVRLQLPALSAGFAAVRWEDPGHVLLDVADASAPHGTLVRCDVRTGACEVTATFTGPHLVAQ